MPESLPEAPPQEFRIQISDELRRAISQPRQNFNTMPIRDMSGSMSVNRIIEDRNTPFQNDDLDDRYDQYMRDQYEEYFGHNSSALKDILGDAIYKVKEKKLESISQETVQRLIVASQSEPPNDLQSRDDDIWESAHNLASADAHKIATEFYSILRGGGTPDDKPNQSEVGFIEIAKAELSGLSDEVDPRIIMSQFSALHALIYSGGLDDLYRKYKIECARKNVQFPTDEEEIIDIKSKLAYEFLDKVRQKNQEEEFSEIPSGIVTVGIEVEYANFIENEARTCGIYETLLEQFNEMIQKADHPVTRAVYEKSKKKVETRLNIFKSLIRDRTNAFVKGAFKIWEPGTKAAIDIGVVDQKMASGVSEIATKPAASYRTQLRELVAISTVGGIRSNWGIHETFGGVELSTEHTEFMDALPIAIAAGFVNFDKVPDNLKPNLDLGYGITGEKYKKTSSGGTYFPFHKARTSSDMDPVANQSRQKGIEVRSLPEYNQKTFSKLVRQLSFHYLFAHGVKSVQKEEASRVPQDEQLITAYNELMTNWQQLLQTKGLSLPTNEDKYIKNAGFFLVSGEEEEKVDQNKYVVFLGRMIVAAQEDPEFSKKTRELVRQYTKKTKEILNQETNK